MKGAESPLSSGMRPQPVPCLTEPPGTAASGDGGRDEETMGMDPVQ